MTLDEDIDGLVRQIEKNKRILDIIGSSDHVLDGLTEEGKVVKRRELLADNACLESILERLRLMT